MVLLITYDLHKPERDYEAVIARIKSFGSCVHDEESVWLADTTKTPEECREALKAVTTNATYFIVQLRQHWSAYKLSEGVANWLNAAERRW